MAGKSKKPRLRDLEDGQLLLEYAIAVRMAWQEYLARGKKNTQFRSYLSRELALKREILRRLKLRC